MLKPLVGIVLLIIFAGSISMQLYAELLMIHASPQDITTAIKINPLNADYLNQKILIESTSLQQHQENLQTYRQLLVLRPTWAPYWAGLVQTKRQLWQYDQEMQEAIRNTTHFGPWFHSAQRIVLIAGYDGWPFLDIKSKKVVQKTLLRALQQQPKVIIRLAIDRGFLPQALPIIQENTGLKDIYEKELQDRKRALKNQQTNKSDA